jgi:hypothetical protein
MANVYLALKKGVVFVLLLVCQAAIAQPVINSFSPTSASPGVPVTINGSGFSPVPGNNIVYFGPVRATVQSGGTNVLNVTVPVGATCAPITVTVNGLTAYSRLPFNVSFHNSNTTLDTSSFGARKNVFGFQSARIVTLADLDRDGRADLFVPNLGNTLTVLRNTSTAGTVSFAPNKNFPGGPIPYHSATGDFDGDGKLDIAVANWNNGGVGSVSVLRNRSVNDTILFDTASYASGNGTHRVTIADIDLDGKPDLLAVAYNSYYISVFRNTTTTAGAITFAPRILISTNPSPYDISITDMDGDGKPDIVSSYGVGNGGVSVWKNYSVPGSISFGIRANYSTANTAVRLKVGDLNEDGKPDVAVANLSSARLSFFRNISSAGNIVLAARQDIATGSRPQSIDIADLNGDGRLDIAVGCDTPQAICIHPGIAGDSIRFGPRVDYRTGRQVNDLTIGDVDGDGEPDLAFPNLILNSGHAVTVLRNLQNGESPIINSFTPTSAATGSFVTITGKYLSTTSAVKFGAAWADSVRIVSDSVVKARVNNGATGNITLYTLYGVATKPGFTYVGDTIPDSTAPVIYSFTPTSGQKGTPVFILGSNFTGTTAVRFGGINADSIIVLSDSVVKAIVDSGATGLVSVITPYGTASKPGFTFIADTIPAPAIKDISPTSGPKGTVVSIFGSSLTGTTAVYFGHVKADSIIVLSDTLIKAIVDTGATGSVSVSTPHGYGYGPVFTYIRDTTNNPDSTLHRPEITNFSPKSGKKGAVITIFGSNLDSTLAVYFGGVKADSIVIISDSVIRATVGSGASGYVAVSTPYGYTSRSGFTFIADTTPVVRNFYPTSGKRGTIVQILGNNLGTTTAVRFGGVLADSVWVTSDTTVRAKVGNGATGSVSVTTPYGTASKAGFTFIADTTPVVRNFYPTSGKRGTIVQILGNNLGTTTAVRFGGVLADSVWVTSDTTVRAKVGNGATGSVSVTTSYGTASKAGFTFIADTTNIPDTTCPVITSFWPTSGQKGTAVYILGNNLIGTSSVRFGGVPADSIVIMSDTMIKAIVDTGATGSVQVISSYCSASKAGFTFIRDTTNFPDTTAPKITSFYPTSGQRGTIVQILGNNLGSTTAVRFGGVLADSLWVTSDTTVRAIVGNGATGSVSVTTTYGTASKAGFTYISDTTINDTLFVNARTAGANGIIQKSFKLYPNPASTYVTWQQPVVNHKTRLQLVDIAGRIVRQMEVGSNTPQTTMQLHGLNTGVYKLVYIDGKNKLTSTLLIK